MKPAQFEIMTVDSRVAYLKDLLADNPKLNCLSVTNDADNVVQKVLKEFPGRRIVYRDTEGNWDELVYDAPGPVTFAPWKGWHP